MGSSSSADLAPLVAYLDQFLSVSEIPDPGAMNGLQVDADGPISRIAAAVDACQATVDAAAISHANLLLVHHGLFWGDTQPVTGRHRRRLKKMFDNDIALYSAHIPLDCHPEVGNNAVLSQRLGLGLT